jgi:2-iminobutanoate/2-iminopropanoate deaminase
LPITPIDPHGSAFAHATHVTEITEWLFVSGQVGTDDNYENPPPTFKEQARVAWKNVERRLSAVGMSMTDIAKVTIYLADRKYRGDNFEVRCEVLGTHRPAITIIAADIYDEAWLLEIEVIAAR